MQTLHRCNAPTQRGDCTELLTLSYPRCDKHAVRVWRRNGKDEYTNVENVGAGDVILIPFTGQPLRDWRHRNDTIR